MRSGAEEPRAIEHIRIRQSPLLARYRFNSDAVGICERSRIALVLASYSPIWGSRSIRMRGCPEHAKSPCPDECSQFLMTTASALRSGTPQRDANFPVE